MIVLRKKILREEYMRRIYYMGKSGITKWNKYILNQLVRTRSYRITSYLPAPTGDEKNFQFFLLIGIFDQFPIVIRNQKSVIGLLICAGISKGGRKYLRYSRGTGNRRWSLFCHRRLKFLHNYLWFDDQISRQEKRTF